MTTFCQKCEYERQGACSKADCPLAAKAPSDERCKLRGFVGARLCGDDCTRAGKCLRAEVEPLQYEFEKELAGLRAERDAALALVEQMRLEGRYIIDCWQHAKIDFQPMLDALANFRETLDALPSTDSHAGSK